jgi:integrase
MEKEVICKTSDAIPFSLMKEICNDLLEKGKWKKALFLAVPSFLLIRFSDYSRLKWGDFNGERILMYEQKTHKHKKKPRNIKIGDEIRSIVKKARPEYAKDSDYIFTSGLSNKPFTIQYVNTELRRIKKAYNIQIEHFSTHSLLKSGCLELFEKNGKTDAALMLICRIRNHSNTGVTLNYLNLNQKAVDAAYDSL